MVEKKRSKKQIKKRKKKACIIVATVLAVVFCMLASIVLVFSDLKAIGIDFSKKSGFYSDSIDLEMHVTGFSMESPLIIKYNMNGDDLNSTTEEYKSAIKLEVPETGYDLYTITATVCNEEQKCIEPITETYVLGRNLDEDVTLDIINVNCSQYDLYDYYDGIMTGGVTFDLNELEGKFDYIPGNYNNRGRKWMRKAFIAMFDNDGSLAMNQGAFIGVSGWTSSASSIKSLKVVLDSVDNNTDDGGEESFRLRSGSHDRLSGNIRSSISSRLIEDANYNGGASTRRVVVFLNGDYYGIFDMQENFSELNIAKKYGITSEKGIVKQKGSETSVLDALGIERRLWEGLNADKGREKIERIIDMDDYLKYYAIQILMNNTDWPMNNYEAWRYKGKKDVDNVYTDGRVRFLVYDTDLIYETSENRLWFDGCDGDTFEHVMEGKYRGTETVFRKVMESEYYRNRFIEILRELINGPFRTENVLKIIDEEAAKIDHQVELWSTPEEYKEWKYWIEVLRGAAASREQEVRDDVFKYFGVVL